MSHEKLRCYRQLMEVAGVVAKKMTTWPRGHGYLEDQLRRAIASAILTLSEGEGKQGSPRERRRFFEMSLGSISEVSSCLDLALMFNLVTKGDCEAMKEKLKISYYQIRRLP